MTVVLVVSYVAMAVILAVTLLYRRFLLRPSPIDPTYRPKVALLLAVRGSDPEFEQHVESLFHLDYPDYEIVFGVAERSDDAYPVLAAACERRPARARLVVTGLPWTCAEKIHNLLGCLAVVSVDAEVLVVMDLDLVLHRSIRDATGQPIGTLPPYVVFHDWTRGEMEALRDMGTIERHRRGAIVIEPGAVSDRAIFIVMAGKYEVHRGGQQRDVLQTGDLVGELAFVDGLPRTAVVRARTDGAMLRVRPEDVDRYAERDPQTALKFVRELARILSFRLRTAWS